MSAEYSILAEGTAMREVGDLHSLFAGDPATLQKEVHKAVFESSRQKRMAQRGSLSALRQIAKERVAKGGYSPSHAP
jgi:hypothetical protein